METWHGDSYTVNHVIRTDGRGGKVAMQNSSVCPSQVTSLTL